MGWLVVMWWFGGGSGLGRGGIRDGVVRLAGLGAQPAVPGELGQGVGEQVAAGGSGVQGAVRQAVGGRGLGLGDGVPLGQAGGAAAGDGGQQAGVVVESEMRPYPAAVPGDGQVGIADSDSLPQQALQGGGVGHFCPSPVVPGDLVADVGGHRVDASGPPWARAISSRRSHQSPKRSRTVSAWRARVAQARARAAAASRARAS